MSILASIDFAHPSGVIATIGASEADPPREANGTEPRGLGNCGVTHGGGLRHNALCNPTPALVSLPGAIGGVVQVAAGLDFSLAVTSSGQLYAFGDNVAGQLGIATNSGTSTPNHTPVSVTLPGVTGGVVQVSAGRGGYGHSLAVTSSGQLYAFGDNFYAELGRTASNPPTHGPNPTPALGSRLLGAQ